VPANVPYSETVVGDVKAAIEAIRVTSSYNYDVASVARWDKDEGADGARPSVRIHSGSQVILPDADGLGLLTFTLPVVIDLRVESDVFDVAHDEAVSYLTADVLKAIWSIDYGTKPYECTSISTDPYLTAESGDLVDFGRVTATFQFQSPKSDLTTTE